MSILELIRNSLGHRVKVLIKMRLGLDRRESYSQFGEDAVLFAYFWGKEWKPRIKSDRKIKKKGFYIDIGSYSPTECSNTYLFYKAGWRGINIDATPGIMDSFNLVRGRDINLNYAIGTIEGHVSFYVLGTPNVFNTMSPEIANERSKTLGIVPAKVWVPCMRLETILDKYLPEGQEIDFFSIDVEGMDLDVLKSNNWEKYRPELVVAEEYAKSFQDLMDSPINKFLHEIDYEIYAWARPSVIWRSCSQVENQR